ncbi:MAG: MaoC/PaaZ C-terminal domain-containing protein [Thermoguttaceae bacterium]|jgi:hypothetical protein
MHIKCFDLEDQRRFASLSGDYNPLHLDPVYSRRLLFGCPVVHGVHLVLYALERLLEGRSSPLALRHLNAVFNHPLPVGKPFHMKILAADDAGFEIQSAGNECHLLGQFLARENIPSDSASLPDKMPTAACRELSFAQAAQARGMAPLYLNPAELLAMFPRISGMIPPVQVAEILATTRLTGMDCPGLNTIFHSLDLNFVETGGRPLAMFYRVNRSDERFSIINLEVDSFGLHGRLSAFYRPSPVDQPSFAQVAEKVSSGEFGQIRALIVGGSRGLGELTAKIIAAGGGEVCFTYNMGKQDAQRVQDEISKCDGKARSFSLDVTSPTAPDWPVLLQDWRPTHMFYYATPHIGSSRSGEPFSQERYAGFCEYYVLGFCRIVESIAPLLPCGLKVFYPSTAYIDAPKSGQEEYIAAKSAGQWLCRYFTRRWPKLNFHIPRLPLLKTDQTAGIQPRRTEDSLEVLLKEIRALV